MPNGTEESYIPAGRLSFAKIKAMTTDAMTIYDRARKLLAMSDDEILEHATNRVSDKKKAVYVNAIRDYAKGIIKLFKGLTGHSEAELDRAAKGEDINNKTPITAGQQLSVEDLKRIFEENNEGDEEQQALFDKVYAVVKNLNLKISTYSDENTDVAAYYQWDNQLRINAHFWNAKRVYDEKTGKTVEMNGHVRASTLLHELIHSVTVYADDLYGSDDPKADNYDPTHGGLSENLQRAVRNLRAVYKAVMEHPDSHILTRYALTNEKELIAELANPYVRDGLHKMGVWARIKNAVLQFFNIRQYNDFSRYEPEEAKALSQTTLGSELSKALDDFLDNFDMDTYRAWVGTYGGSAKDMRSEMKVESVADNADKLNDKARHDSQTLAGESPKDEFFRNAQRDGLDRTLGHDNYTSLMRDIYTHLRNPELSKFVRDNVWHNNLDVYKTTQAFFASIADKPGHETLWQDYQQKVNDALQKAGIKTQLGLRQAKYLAWLAEHPSDPLNPIKEAERVAARRRIMNERIEQPISNGEFQDFPTEDDRKLKTENEFSHTSSPAAQSPSAPHTPQAAPFSASSVPTAVESDKFESHFAQQGSSLPPTATPVQHMAKATYEKLLEDGSFVWKEAHVDYMQAAQELVRAVTGKKGDTKGVLKENEDFLNGENQLSSRTKDMSDIFQATIMKPLTKTIQALLPEFGKKRKEAMTAMQTYMITKHALERNRVFFIRDMVRRLQQDGRAVDALNMESTFYGEKNRLDTLLDNGTITLAEYYQQLDSTITTLTKPITRHNFDPSKLGKGNGLSVLFGDGKGAYDDAAAIQSVMDTEERIGRDRINELWDRTEAAARFSVSIQNEGGLISQELAGHLNSMFKWYVPLRGFDMTMAEDVYPYLSEDFDPKNEVAPVLKNADGRVSLADRDIFARMAAMASKAISTSLQNRDVNQRFLNFVHDYYNVDGKDRLVTEVKHWIVKTVDPQTGAEVWEESFPNLTKKVNGKVVPVTDAAEVEQIVTDWENDMQARKAKGEAKVVNEKNTIPYRFIKASNRSQHIVVAYQKGERHVLIVNGNPRAAEAINGLLRPESGNNIFNKIVRGVSQLVTTYQPDFVVRNTFRDAWFAAYNNFINEGFDYWRRYCGNYVKIATAGVGSGMSFGSLFYRYKKGTLNPNKADDMYFKEFMENGGETGWAGMEDVKKWQAKISADVMSKNKRGVLDALTALPRLLVFANEHAENIARFATYITSRKAGRSVTRSIADAKEVSVNFNRKGAGKKSTTFRTENDNEGRQQSAYWAGVTAQWLRGNIMFYNAGMQGLNTFAKNIKYHPVRSTAATALFFALGGFIAPAINQALQDMEDRKDRNVDNPYAELPEYLRRQNLCIYVGKGNFITIPLPIELRAMFGIGDMTASFTSHPELSNGENPVVDVASQLSQILPVDFLGENNSFFMALVPAYVKPFFEAGLPTALFKGKENGLTEGTNTKWNGMPIRRDRSDWNQYAPQWQRAFTSTGDFYVKVAKFLDRKTNPYDDPNVRGWLDIDPAATQHYTESFLGGLATTANNLGAVIKEVAADPSFSTVLKSSHTPLLRTLHYTPDERNRYFRTRSKWFVYKEKADRFQADMKALSIDRANPLDYAKTKSAAFAKQQKISQTMRQAEKTYDAYTKLIKLTVDPKQKDSYMMQREQLMYDTVQQLEKLE